MKTCKFYRTSTSNYPSNNIVENTDKRFEFLNPTTEDSSWQRGFEFLNSTTKGSNLFLSTLYLRQQISCAIVCRSSGHVREKLTTKSKRLIYRHRRETRRGGGGGGGVNYDLLLRKTRCSDVSPIDPCSLLLVFLLFFFFFPPFANGFLVESEERFICRWFVWLQIFFEFDLELWGVFKKNVDFLRI